jgi:hypothetical protein
MKHRDSPLSSNVRPPPTASAWPLSAPNVPFPPTKPQLRSALPPLRRAAHAREECPIRLASLAGDHPSSERMTRVEHSEATIGELRAEYFRQRGFPADGGSSARWVRYPLFGGHVVLPNVKSRQRALPLHDLHHLVTGYDTSWRGEAEIAAWELAAGMPWLCSGVGPEPGGVRDWGGDRATSSLAGVRARASKHDTVPPSLE